MWEAVKRKLASASWGFRIGNEDRMVEVVGGWERSYMMYIDGEYVGSTIYVDVATRFLREV